MLLAMIPLTALPPCPEFDRRIHESNAEMREVMEMTRAFSILLVRMTSNMQTAYADSMLMMEEFYKTYRSNEYASYADESNLNDTGNEDESEQEVDEKPPLNATDDQPRGDDEESQNEEIEDSSAKSHDEKDSPLPQSKQKQSKRCSGLQIHSTILSTLKLVSASIEMINAEQQLLVDCLNDSMQTFSVSCEQFFVSSLELQQTHEKHSVGFSNYMQAYLQDPQRPPWSTGDQSDDTDCGIAKLSSALLTATQGQALVKQFKHAEMSRFDVVEDLQITQPLKLLQNCQQICEHIFDSLLGFEDRLATNLKGFDDDRIKTVEEDVNSKVEMLSDNGLAWCQRRRRLLETCLNNRQRMCELNINSIVSLVHDGSAAPDDCGLGDQSESTHSVVEKRTWTSSHSKVMEEDVNSVVRANGYFDVLDSCEYECLFASPSVTDSYCLAGHVIHQVNKVTAMRCSCLED
jgi:hypothetical protein